MSYRSITEPLQRFEEPAYAALRIVAGAMFSFHGVQKIFGFMATNPGPAIGSQIWVGGIIELIGGLMIAAGLFTRAAALLCSGTMAVAYFQFHWKLAFADFQWLPSLNKGELAALYCFVFLFIAMKGSGAISVDRRLGSK